MSAHARTRYRAGELAAADEQPWRAGLVATDALLAPLAGDAGLLARQRTRLTALLRAAQRDSPLYRGWLAGRDVERLQLDEMPIVRKADLMARFDEWVGDPRLTLNALRRFVSDPAAIGEPFLGRYTVWESSGSSGEPGLFVQDPGAMAVYDVLEAQRRPLVRPWVRWFDPWGWTERFVFVGATGGHFASTVTIERLRRRFPQASARMTSVSFLQPLAELARRLDTLAPTLLATYPSAAVLLAQARERGDLRMAPAEIWTGGEMLSHDMAAYVSKTFGCPVLDSYGASECLALASCCALGALHLNADWAILEPVDADGRAAAPGESGATTLLTNLANHVQPIIRYDLGDRVAISPRRCACGSHLPVIAVQGRSDDTLRLTGSDGRVTQLLPLAISTVLEEDAGLYDFQLVQTSPGELRLNGSGGAPGLERGRRVLSQFLRAQGARGVRIRCSSAACTFGASGKLRRIVREGEAGAPLPP